MFDFTNSLLYYFLDTTFIFNTTNVKTLTLTGEEFLRRFCLHILPRRFVKIRYYGIYSSRYRSLHNAGKMVIRVKEDIADRLKRLTGFDVKRCPVCKTGVLIKVEVIPRIRSPSFVFPASGAHLSKSTN